MEKPGTMLYFGIDSLSFPDIFEYAKKVLVQELTTTINFASEARLVIVKNILFLFAL